MEHDKSNNQDAMDYEAHKRTFEGFWFGMQLVTAVTVVILILLAITLL